LSVGKIVGDVNYLNYKTFRLNVAAAVYGHSEQGNLPAHQNRFLP
jgi:hypothetical protein